jgi:uncharacterized C2H2 Zn-finger protein
MDNLEREIKKIKNLKQNQGKSEEELTSLAKDNLEKQEIISSLKFCSTDKEREFALDLLGKYLTSKSFENPAERDTLRNLIDFEVILDRVKDYINTETSKANPVPPVQMIDQLQKFSEHIESLKDKLSLTQKEAQKNVLEEWDKLKAKALAHYKESAGCNVVRCPECKKLFMILKDIKGHTTEKITFFKRTLLYNKALFELYDKKIIDTAKMAEILGVSEEYIALIYENTYKNDKKE